LRNGHASRPLPKRSKRDGKFAGPHNLEDNDIAIRDVVKDLVGLVGKHFAAFLEGLRDLRDAGTAPLGIDFIRQLVDVGFGREKTEHLRGIALFDGLQVASRFVEIGVLWHNG
jgi:hypothetical protein